MFSVIIPTFNNLEFLKLCLNSLKKNSKYDHEIIVHVNEGSDGTLDFIKKSKIKYTYSDKNEGVCVAFNKGANISSKEFFEKNFPTGPLAEISFSFSMVK